MSDIINMEYFSETYDDKVAGKLLIPRDTIVACYTLPKYPKRTMILTDQGHKFCIKGRPEEVLSRKEELLQESGDAGS